MGEKESKAEAEAEDKDKDKEEEEAEDRDKDGAKDKGDQTRAPSFERRVSSGECRVSSVERRRGTCTDIHRSIRSGPTFQVPSSKSLAQSATRHPASSIRNNASLLPSPPRPAPPPPRSEIQILRGRIRHERPNSLDTQIFRVGFFDDFRSFGR